MKFHRAPFQVLVFPFIWNSPETQPQYAIFRRKDEGYWQGIAGGGEGGEDPLAAARREAEEEAGIKRDNEFIRLDSTSTIPVVNVCGFEWGKDVLVIPEYTFGVKLTESNLKLSREHSEVSWKSFAETISRLKWDSNKNALWELNWRLTRSAI
jgi:dATP pyrophosphohydrolase